MVSLGNCEFGFNGSRVLTSSLTHRLKWRVKRWLVDVVLVILFERCFEE
jgi:hypothetical protein